jgi:hypothetical protein
MRAHFPQVLVKDDGTLANLVELATWPREQSFTLWRNLENIRIPLLGDCDPESVVEAVLHDESAHTVAITGEV